MKKHLGNPLYLHTGEDGVDHFKCGFKLHPDDTVQEPKYVWYVVVVGFIMIGSGIAIHNHWITWLGTAIGILGGAVSISALWFTMFMILAISND